MTKFVPKLNTLGDLGVQVIFGAMFEGSVPVAEYIAVAEGEPPLVSSTWLLEHVIVGGEYWLTTT